MPRLPVQTSGVGIVPEFDGIMDDMSTKYVQNFEADYLNKISGRIDHGIAKQNMHFNLVKLLNNYAQFKNSIIYHDKTRSTERCNEFLTFNEINKAVIVLTDILNLSAGSSGHVDLYRLLQEYLLDPEKRKKINGIVKSFDL
jgi:hypothetical protein